MACSFIMLRSIVKSIGVTAMILSGAIVSVPFIGASWAIGKLYGINVIDESGLVYHRGKESPVVPKTILESAIAGIGPFGWYLLMGPFALLPAVAIFLGSVVGALIYPFGH